MAVPRLFLAFDGLREKPDETIVTMHRLAETGKPFGIKFNLDAMLHTGDEPLYFFIDKITRLGLPVFGDLKMWNGSRTMEAVIKTFVALGVDFVNVYALADRKQLEKAVKATEGSKTKILGLTVLSHYDDAYCQKWFKRTVREAVVDFSRFALEAGLHGILLPGTMLGEVNDLDTIKAATGVRPKWYTDSRHEQEATPAEVVKGGATFGVCGSPILKQPTDTERIAAFLRILDEMQAVA